MEKTRSPIVRRIARNGVVAALYYGLTMLMILVLAISQFGVIQCRFSEMLVLLAFFDPSLIFGLTLGCLLANVTGVLMGQAIALDILFGTLATLIACLLEAYVSKFLFVAALWPVAINGIVVGTELYFFLNAEGLPIYLCMFYVALGELIALAVGYVVFMIIARNKSMLRVIGAHPPPRRPFLRRSPPPLRALYFFDANVYSFSYEIRSGPRFRLLWGILRRSDGRVLSPSLRPR